MQFALSVTLVPTFATPLLAVSEHAGRAAGSTAGEHMATGIDGGPYPSAT